MPRRIDIPAGTRFGDWTVIADLPSMGRKEHGRSVLAACSCGTRRAVKVGYLLSGRTESCGCKQPEKARVARTTHGLIRTPEYKSWCHMIERCHRENNPQFARYGARGIVVCERWRSSFESFIADMGMKPSARHTIDRINNDGNYEPDNCRWATQTVQQRNRSNNLLLTIGERTAPAAQWAEERGMDPRLVYERLRRGWSADRAITERKKERAA